MRNFDEFSIGDGSLGVDAKPHETRLKDDSREQWLEESAAPVESGSLGADRARIALPRAKELLERFPHEIEANLAYGTLLNLTRTRVGVLEAWEAIHERFPDSGKVLIQRVAALKRQDLCGEARCLIERHRPATCDSPEALVERADLFFSIADFAEAKATFESALRRFPDDAQARLSYAKRLKMMGAAQQARECLTPLLDGAAPIKGVRAVANELDLGLAVMRRIRADRVDRGDDTNLIAIDCLLAKLASRRTRALSANRIGATALITGSLGPGGAERQLAGTAELLSGLLTSGAPFGGVSVEGPLHTVVRSLAHEEERDFHIDRIAGKPVLVCEIDNMAPVSLTDIETEDPEIAALLPFMTAPINFGICRLTKWFCQEKIDIAYIWQDGAILYSALAALLAGVPRLVLNFRGLPPCLRRHLLRPEYEELYKGLLSVPGVSFVSNTRVTAAAYSKWLSCSPRRFSVNRNGVDELRTDGEPSDVEAWSQFNRRTAGATHTIGGVFRLDIDKRPLLWVEFACRHLDAHPRARFVLVGRGPMLATAKRLAEEKGKADRILFVGRSCRVGFWLSKFDVFLLLSRFEGLPNVLVEAQLAGVGVVSTPAGGACEAFVEGVTGLSMGSIDGLDLDDVSAKVCEVLRMARSDPQFALKTRRIAQRRFAPSAMLERTLRILASVDGLSPREFAAAAAAVGPQPGFEQRRAIEFETAAPAPSIAGAFDSRAKLRADRRNAAPPILQIAFAGAV